MNRKSAWAAIALFNWLVCGEAASPVDPSPGAKATTNAIADLCASDGRFSVKRAKVFQDELRKPDLTRKRLLSLAASLQEGTRNCLRPMSLTDTTLLTGLEVGVGDRFLGMHEYALAREALSTANAMFERSNLPNDVWLHSLELAAYAEIGANDLQRAADIAADEVALARSWVNEGLDKKYELARALRFEAHVLTLKNELAKAAEVSKEADSLESKTR